MFKDQLMQRAATSEALSIEEFSAIELLIKKCCPQFKLKKVKAKEEFLITENENKIINPVTGYIYKKETAKDLAELCKSNSWCGKFATKIQWQKIGRKISNNAQPYSFGHYNRVANLFAIEQTEI